MNVKNECRTKTEHYEKKITELEMLYVSVSIDTLP